jgi:hypothetical protein
MFRNVQYKFIVGAKHQEWHISLKRKSKHQWHILVLKNIPYKLIKPIAIMNSQSVQLSTRWAKSLL